MMMPQPKARFDEMVRAFAAERGRASFELIIDWIRQERDRHDQQNRIPGQENKVSAAGALSTILDLYSIAGGKAPQTTL